MIVESALSLVGKNVLITTYTNENLDQIRSYFLERCGLVPEHVTVLSWFTFLLQHGVRPYQNQVTSRPRIPSIAFGTLPTEAQFTRREDVERFFFDTNGNVFSERTAELACACDANSNGKVVERLSQIYDHIFIDEMQDLAGFDLEFLKRLFMSEIGVTAVGDPRQGTFSTNRGKKNAKFRKSGIAEWISQQREADLISVTERNECYRCNQAICDFADALFLNLPATRSLNKTITGHDGIFTISKKQVLSYVAEHKPIVLRWDKRSDTMGLQAINIGVSKGRTYDRVLIFPTKPMVRYLSTKKIEDAGDLSKFYVAVTRARFSVSFVVG